MPSPTRAFLPLAALLVAVVPVLVTALPGLADSSTDQRSGEVSVSATQQDPEVVVEPVFQPSTAARAEAADLADDPAAPEASAADADSALTLHSRPGSRRTLFIDVDGQAVGSTEWTRSQGLPDNYVAAPWSVDSDPAFSAIELDRIETMWAGVAEDFAPFDVDVTTEDPGAAAIDRTDASDQVYGTRVLLTDSDAWTSICGGVRCGGVAFIDAFDVTGTQHPRLQPAWVFPQNFADDVKLMADVVSHEAGHTFGLHHDGTVNPSNEYYGGHGAWGPIMGSPGSVPVTQWSRGEQASATTTEDDVALIAANGAPLVPDAVGDTVAAAASGLPAAGRLSTGVIGTASDVDVYRLRSCSGPISVRATPAGTNPDLDIDLRLLNSAGQLVAADNPAVARTSRVAASGLDATVSTNAAGADYYVRVDGTGWGDPASNGYSDYASVGRYSLALSGSCDLAAGVASSPQNVQAQAGGTAITVTWAPPSSSGTSPINGYRVTASGGSAANRELSTDANGRGVTFTDLARATSYTFSVVATNPAGNGAAAVATAATGAIAPGAVAALNASTGADGVVVLDWTAPVDDGGSPVTGYRVQLGPLDRVLDANIGRLTINGLPGGAANAVIRAVNVAGEGAATSRSIVVGGEVSADTTVTVESSAGRRSARTSTRPTLSGKPVVGSRLHVRPGTKIAGARMSYRWTAKGRVVSRAASYRVSPAAVGTRVAVTVTMTAPRSKPVTTTIRSGKIGR